MAKTIVKKKSTLKKRTSVKKSFPIVAIGSSAGGLDAISTLLTFLPADTGMAFIYVQHLSPDQKSLTTALLSRQTKMKVQEIKQMELIKPNNVYVIPNDKGIEVTDGHIKLISREIKSQTNLSADTLFISLAQTHTDEVIGVVLSGNASDGTQGLRAIKSEGGITFAQDASAKNSSMPGSAIAAGVVDFIMSPKDIALNLSRLGEHFKKNGTLHFISRKNDVLSDVDLKSVVSMVYDRTGIDFSLYKVNTIRRRILRRILLNNVKSVRKYIQLLSDNKKEIDLLQADMLINFTSFFRDPETYEYLRKKLFPRLLKTRSEKDPLRIWTVACSTGEEAFSLAMVLQEALGKEPAHGRIQIFATDLSSSALRKARTGLFTAEELSGVSKPRIARFFIDTPQGFRISKSVRDMCVFATHNVLSEPPFSRLDLICCCNMLIYMDVAAQQQIMSTFHYSLRDKGYLILGKSETIGASSHLFAQDHKKLKVFTSKKHSSKPVLNVNRTKLRPKPLDGVYNQAVVKQTAIIPGELERRFDAILLERFFPACVVINSSNEITFFRGKTSAYLQNHNGKASLNILKMARSHIAFDLRTLISKATASNAGVKSSVIEISEGRNKAGVIIEVIPFAGPGDESFFIILFSEASLEENKPFGAGKRTNGATKVMRSESKMARLKADMLLMMKDHEGSTQLLQSANEEIISSNEELQSLNEELETSREEIESTNEELNATIQELLAQNQLLAESYRYSEDIIATLHEPMVVLDHELNVKTANAAYYKFFKGNSESTEGKSFYKLDNKRWDIPKLRVLLENILSKNAQFQGFPVSFIMPSKVTVHLLLNAKRIVQKGHMKNLILLAMARVSSADLETAIKKTNGEK